MSVSQSVWNLKSKGEWFAVIVVTALLTVVSLFVDSSALRIVSATLVFCFLPGFLLTALLFPREDALDRLERALLSAGAGYLLSTLALVAVHLLPGEMTLVSSLLALDLVIALLLALTFVHGRGLYWPSIKLTPKRDFIYVLILLLLVSFFRFASLGYSEYQGDETDVTWLAQAAIRGEDEAFFLHKKGPVELVTAAAFALLTGGFNELAIRFPFALASALAVMAAYLLARRMFGGNVALLGGALLAIEGVFLGFSRMVQYHGVVVLMLTLSVYCFYRVYELGGSPSLRVEDKGLANRYQVLGALFFSLSLLAHYEAALMALVLAFLYFKRYGRRFVKENGPALLLSGGLCLVIPLAYYLPFALHPHFAQTLERYTQIRISLERGPYNNLGTYLPSYIFYNSVYYAAVMVLALFVAGVRALWNAMVRKWVALALSLLFIAGFAGSVLFPSLFTVGGVRYHVFLFLPLWVAFALAGGMGTERQALFLWFLSYLIIYSFLLRVPGLHYYCLSPAWAILAALGLADLDDLVRGKKASREREVVPLALALALAFVVFAFYTSILFIRTDPEYALTYPQHRNPIYWNTHSDPPRRFFGFPHKSGWKAIAYLYRTGQLKGSYRSNEKEEIPNWYIRWEPTDVERPAYYFIAENATEKKYEQDYPRELISAEYQLVGTVFVGGKPRLHIYQLKPLTSTGGTVARYDVENYEALYDQAISLPP